MFNKKIPFRISKIVDFFRRSSKNCLCVIAHKPNIHWLEFLQQFNRYDTFIIIDDNAIDYNELYKKQYPRIKFIQIENQICQDNGFVNTNHELGKLISGWDKALYYFSTENKRYEHVWFLEDDVFIYNEDTLLNIDSKYIADDILSANCIGKWKCKNWTHWKKITINFKPPYYKSMVCATRLSDRMLRKVSNYAQKNNTLFFLEALFPTLAKKHQFKYSTPPELKSITWRNEWDVSQINTTHIFHPIKNQQLHSVFRRSLSTLS